MGWFRSAVPLAFSMVACGANDDRATPLPSGDSETHVFPRWTPTGALGVTHSHAAGLGHDVSLGKEVELSLPEDADGWVRVSDRRSRVSASFRLLGARNARRVETRDMLVYPDALGADTFVAQRPLLHGVEDFVGFRSAPREPHVRYEVEVLAAGLRLVDDVLELVDANGAPRLRMARPTIVDRHGVSHRGRVSVDGCRVDRSPAPPWGVKPVAPGQSVCLVQIDLDLDDGDYPAVLDPAWTLTSSLMNSRRFRHTATRLPSGLVLIAGGLASTAYTAPALDSVELYDPSSNSFASAAPMAQARSDHQSVLIGNDVLVVGPSTAERYSNAQWLPAGSTVLVRSGRGVGVWGGKVIACGGSSGSTYHSECEQWDPQTNSWTLAPYALLTGRADLELITAASELVAVGGVESGTASTAVERLLFVGGSWKWQQQLPLASGHWLGATVLLPNNKLLVAGGWHGTLGLSNSSQLVGPNGAEAATTNLPFGVTLLEGGVLPNGRVLITGGAPGLYGAFAQATIFDLSSNSWSSVSGMTQLRIFHQLTMLADGGALVTGGYPGFPAVGPIPAVHDTAEVFRLLGNGEKCFAAAECQSDHCVDGVCCESACTAPCQACVAAKSSASDGICAPVSKGTDPDSDCNDNGAPSCGANGSCDGAGACDTYPPGTVCVDASCVGALSSWQECSTGGQCASAQQQNCGTFGCVAGVCSTSCSVDNDCAVVAFCVGGTCTAKKSDGDPCSLSSECAHGFCVDGVCCDGACTGQCESCAEAQSLGKCIPVQGQPRLGRPPCAPAIAVDQPCSARRCDGVTTGECTGYAPADTVCSVGACVDAQQTFESHCDGLGLCPAPNVASCEPYACGAQGCLTSCETSDDCVEGATCSADGECVSGSYCKDEFTLVSPAGDEIPCKAYICESDRCLDSCTSIAQCAPPYACNEKGQCVPPAAEEDDGGCGCRDAGTRPNASGLLAFGLGAALVVFAKRRRRRMRRLPRRRLETME